MATFDEVMSKCNDQFGYMVSTFDDLSFFEEKWRIKIDPNYDYRRCIKKFVWIFLQSLFQYSCTDYGVSQTATKFLTGLTKNYDLFDTPWQLDRTVISATMSTQKLSTCSRGDILQLVDRTNDLGITYVREPAEVFAAYELRTSADRFDSLKRTRQILFDGLAEIDPTIKSHALYDAFLIDVLIDQIGRKLRK